MMRTTAALLLLLASQLSLWAQDRPVPFVIGIWGENDAVIPFADFDGERWRSSWPEPVEVAAPSRPLQRIPASWWGRSTFERTWELIEPDGGRRSIQLTGTAGSALGSGCSLNIGLKTNAPPNVYRYREVLATNRAGVVQPVEALKRSATEWRTVSTVLPEIYLRYEPGAWKNTPDSFRPNLSDPLSEPMLDSVGIFRDELGEYVYFESSRKFALKPNQLGSEHSFITGWLWRRSATAPFQLVNVQAQTNDDDSKGVDSFHPLGVVRHGSRRFWIGVLSSYAYSGMTVLDVRRAGIKRLLTVGYAGC